MTNIADPQVMMDEQTSGDSPATHIVVGFQQRLVGSVSLPDPEDGAAPGEGGEVLMELRPGEEVMLDRTTDPNVVQLLKKNAFGQFAALPTGVTAAEGGIFTATDGNPVTAILYPEAKQGIV